MGVYVKLQDDVFDDNQHSKDNGSSSFCQKIGNLSTTKKFSIFLIFVLLINIFIVIAIVKNKISFKVNELTIDNEENIYDDDSSNLSYEQPLPDYSDDINDDQRNVVLDNFILEDNQMNDEQMSSKFEDKAEIVIDEDHQVQNDY